MKVGQRVVCVRASQNSIKNLIKGEIYKITSFTCGGLGVIVDGAVSQFVTNGFRVDRFREIEDNWAGNALEKALKEAKEELILS